MSIRKKRISIDLAKQVGKVSYQELAYIKSDRNVSGLEIEFLNNETPYDLNGFTVLCNIVKSDGKCIVNYCSMLDAQRGLVDVPFEEQALASSGANFLEIVLRQGDVIITSPIITYNVIKSILSESNETVISSSEFPVLIDLIDKVNTLKNEIGTMENEIRNSESGRVLAENDRVSSEAIREESESKRNLSESTRVANETLRLNQELQRRNNETRRVSDENTRNTSEQSRSLAEDSREDNESERVHEEIIRLANEEIRISNEETRTSQEQSRVSSENIRVSNENVRQSQEVKRQESIVNIKNEADNKLLAITNEFDKLLLSKQQDAEVIMARESLNGIIYDSLNDRLNAIENSPYVLFETIEG